MAGEQPSKAVDAIWAQLNAKSAAAQRVGLGGFAGIPGITSRVRTVSKSGGQSKPAPKTSYFEQLASRDQSSQPAAQPSDVEQLLALLQRDINGLTAQDRTTRRQAIERLTAALVPSGAGATAAPSFSLQALQGLVTGPLLVPLVRLLADPAERCRELAAALLAGVAARMPDPAALLPVLLPALVERIGSSPVEELSEEVRLALVDLVAGPLLGRITPLPADALPGCTAVVARCLEDSYADVRKAACKAVTNLAAGTAAAAGAPDALEPHLEPLLRGCLACLLHQHSRVRQAGLGALAALVGSSGGVPLPMLEAQVLPALRPLAHDHAVAVRALYFSSAAGWIGGSGGGRLAAQRAALVPLLLPEVMLGLTDEVQSMRTATYEQLEHAGAAYMAAAEADQAVDAIAVDGVRPANALALPPACLPGHPHPFDTCQPGTASRQMVQQELPRLLPQALAGLKGWTLQQRQAAARLLHMAALYAGGGILPHLPPVVQGLCGAVSDDDPAVVSHAVATAHVIGASVPASHWLPLAGDSIVLEHLTAGQRAAGLAVLAALLHGAGRAAAIGSSGSSSGSDSILQQPKEQVATAAATMLSQAAAAAADDDARLREQLLAAAFNLIEWAGPECSAAGVQLCGLLLRLAALEGSSRPSSGLAAGEVLARLADACRQPSVVGLCGAFGGSLLSEVTQGHEAWAASTPGWQVTSSLLQLCEGTTLAQLLPLALPALAAAAAGLERDAALRLQALQLVDALLEDDSNAAAWQAPGLAWQLTEAVLLPPLVWQAGQVAAALRCAAVTALATQLSRRLLPAADLAAMVADSNGRLLPALLGCLDEDYMPDTRHMACYALEQLLLTVGSQLRAEQLQALLPPFLKRLDDSSNDIRVAACGVLLAVAACLPPSWGDGEVGSLVSTVLVHMGDFDGRVRDAACQVLEALGAARPAALQALAASSPPGLQNRADPLVVRVLAACGAG